LEKNGLARQRDMAREQVTATKPTGGTSAANLVDVRREPVLRLQSREQRFGSRVPELRVHGLCTNKGLLAEQRILVAVPRDASRPIMGKKEVDRCRETAQSLDVLPACVVYRLERVFSRRRRL
jgi:hypothetical protein